MASAAELYAEALRFRHIGTSEGILDCYESMFRFLAPTHFLVASVPLPGRAVEPMILRRRWGGRWPEDRLTAHDAVFREGAALKRPLLVSEFPETLLVRSVLCRSAVEDGARRLLWVPVAGFQPYQAVTLVGIPAGEELDPLLVDGFASTSTEAFQQLFALKAVSSARPGDLSEQERRVVALSAGGKTAIDIAERLGVANRTVQAHLQSASKKLQTRNKTQTVVEALRYGQIAI